MKPAHYFWFILLSLFITSCGGEKPHKTIEERNTNDCVEYNDSDITLMSSARCVLLKLPNPELSYYYLPPNIIVCEKAEKIYAQNIGLVNLGGSLYRFKNLKEFYLDKNHLGCDDPRFCLEIDHLMDIKTLEVLTLSENSLANFPDEFDTKLKLRKLNVSYNAIQSDPDNLSEMTSLEDLDLSFNQIQTCDSIFEKLVKLKHLNLRSNDLQKISPTLNSCINLETLDLSNNPLSQTKLEDVSGFASLSKLKEINIRNTQLPNEVIVWLEKSFPGKILK